MIGMYTNLHVREIYYARNVHSVAKEGRNLCGSLFVRWRRVKLAYTFTNMIHLIVWPE